MKLLNEDIDNKCLEGLLNIYKDLCINGKYDGRMPKSTAYNIIIDIERIGEYVPELKGMIDDYLNNVVKD